MDSVAVFAKLKEFFPDAKEIDAVTVVKEFTELAYKDHEKDVKFAFVSPHTIKMTYHANKVVSIYDEEFGINVGNDTEDKAMLNYICYLDFIWKRYVEKK